MTLGFQQIEFERLICTTLSIISSIFRNEALQFIVNVKASRNISKLKAYAKPTSNERNVRKDNTGRSFENRIFITDRLHRTCWNRIFKTIAPNTWGTIAANDAQVSPNVYLILLLLCKNFHRCNRQRVMAMTGHRVAPSRANDEGRRSWTSHRSNLKQFSGSSVSWPTTWSTVSPTWSRAQFPA